MTEQQKLELTEPVEARRGAEALAATGQHPAAIAWALIAIAAELSDIRRELHRQARGGR